MEPSMTDAEILSDLKRLRTERGLTQRELARQALCSEVMITRYERQSARPSARTMARLKVALGLVSSESGGTRAIRHTFHLRLGMPVTFDLPGDLTKAEAERLARFIRSLPFQVEAKDPS
jgi:transcriptional regulator with XRE-family HTH domain